MGFTIALVIHSLDPTKALPKSSEGQTRHPVASCIPTLNPEEPNLFVPKRQIFNSSTFPTPAVSSPTA